MGFPERNSIVKMEFINQQLKIEKECASYIKRLF